MKKFKRIITIVMDSVGAGAMPDAAEYGDVGADTLGHIAEKVDLQIPNLRKLGLANLHSMRAVEPVREPMAYYTKMKEASNGKDTMTGHWEMMGLHITEPFKTFTDTGFPQELLDELSKRTGHNIVGNKAASGTEILDELGEHHMQTGDMIVYTSADSVLQICGHEETFGLDELYRCCEIARDITMHDAWKVGRVIARPFVGPRAHEFKRTSNRHDYALKPFGHTVLDSLKEAHYDVIAVGKINDIFDGEGVSEAIKTKSNVDGMNQTMMRMEKDFTGLCFVNLVDFDALWGHRRNIEGYAKELETFDAQLGELLTKLRPDDLLVLTADHGNDPGYSGSDHTREMVPLLFYSPSLKGAGLLPLSESFAYLGATIADNFEVEIPTLGKSYLDDLK
ncbi:MAG: phosphopentomutase [Erysipelotrichaceae bacterium]